jgi:hypothetical protein
LRSAPGPRIWEPCPRSIERRGPPGHSRAAARDRGAPPGSHPPAWRHAGGRRRARAPPQRTVVNPAGG